MADLEHLKSKYAPVVSTIEEFSDEGAAVEDLSLQGDKLHLKVSVPSQLVSNRVWDAIKQVDPQYSDLHHEITVSGSGDQTYNIRSGDNLSKISKHFYGSPNHYDAIAKENGITDPNKIQPGQDIVIPLLNK